MPGPIFWERPGGMRGGPREDNGGVREQIPAENRGREPRRRQGTLELGLARRPQWGGGSLRAFRRARVNSTLYRWRVDSGDLQI